MQLLSFGQTATCIAAKCIGAAQIQKRYLWIHQRNLFERWQDLVAARKDLDEEKRRIKEFMPLDHGLHLSPEQVSDVMPKKAFEDISRKDGGAMPLSFYSNRFQLRYVDWSFDNLRQCKEYRNFKYLQYDQRFMPDRLLFLGPDLAAAHFIVHRMGAIKFVGEDEWHRRIPNKGYNLPTRKIPGFYVEAIDASNTELMFEGFDNLYDLKHLRMLSLANVARADDWMLSRVGGMFSESLEMLDLTGCKRISAKGLLGLRSLKKLRYLRLDGLDKIKDIAKSALLLEEAIPDLTVVGLDYDAALNKLENEQKLLQNDRVLIDARGNAFVEDDNGQLFYVHGNVNERACVCDEDKPLVTSTIRREIPKMSDAEFEELDQLSNGKLRHFLLGSPSGYSWNEQVETILSFEQGWKEFERVHVDAKMLPKERRSALLQSIEKSKASQLEGDDKMEIPKISNSV